MAQADNVNINTDKSRGGGSSEDGGWRLGMCSIKTCFWASLTKFLWS